MAQVTESLEADQKLLEQAINVPLNCSKFLPQGPDKRKPSEEVPCELRIQAAFDRLKRIKAQHIAVRTHKIFLSHLASGRPVEEIATAQATGLAEATLRSAKQTLRTVKASRMDATRRLAEAASSLGAQIDSRDAEAVSVEALLRRARCAARAGQVAEALESRDLRQIEALVDHIDEVDGPACEDLVFALREEKELANRLATQSRERVDVLRSEVDALREEVSTMEKASSELQEKIAGTEEEVKGAAQMKKECMFQENLEGVMASLGGVRIIDIRSNGMSFEICAHLVQPYVAGDDRSKATHVLDVQMDDSALTGEVTLDPPEVEVTDLQGKALPWVLRNICSRLAQLHSGHLTE